MTDGIEKPSQLDVIAPEPGGGRESALYIGRDADFAIYW
jgi:hypothetical protein